MGLRQGREPSGVSTVSYRRWRQPCGIVRGTPLSMVHAPLRGFSEAQPPRPMLFHAGSALVVPAGLARRFLGAPRKPRDAPAKVRWGEGCHLQAAFSERSFTGPGPKRTTPCSGPPPRAGRAGVRGRSVRTRGVAGTAPPPPASTLVVLVGSGSAAHEWTSEDLLRSGSGRRRTAHAHQAQAP